MRYYIDNSRGDIEAYAILSSITPIADRFSGIGHHVVENGEIKPMNVAPVIAPSPNGKPAMYAMMWGIKTNDKAETVYELSIEDLEGTSEFKIDLERHRCIIPISYFSAASTRENSCRYYCYPKQDDIVWMCGIYRNIGSLSYFAVITARSCGGVRCYIDRIPMMIHKDMIDTWICPCGNMNQVVEERVLYVRLEGKPDD